MDQVNMGTNGRILIPANIRHQIGMEHGGSFVMHVENGDLRLEPMARAIARVQSLVASYVPAGTSLADELAAERRAEAARE